MNYDSPSSLRWVNVTLTVTDPTGLVTNTSSFNVTINDVNQAPRFLNYPLSTLLVSENRYVMMVDGCDCSFGTGVSID